MKLFNIFRILITVSAIIIFSEKTVRICEFILKVILLITCILITYNICSFERVDTKKQWRYDKIEIDTHKRKLCKNNNTEKKNNK